MQFAAMGCGSEDEIADRPIGPSVEFLPDDAVVARTKQSSPHQSSPHTILTTTSFAGVEFAGGI